MFHHFYSLCILNFILSTLFLWVISCDFCVQQSNTGVTAGVMKTSEESFMSDSFIRFESLNWLANDSFQSPKWLVRFRPRPSPKTESNLTSTAAEGRGGGDGDCPPARRAAFYANTNVNERVIWTNLLIGSLPRNERIESNQWKDRLCPSLACSQTKSSAQRLMDLRAHVFNVSE